MEVQKKKKKRAPLVTGRRKSARLWLLCWNSWQKKQLQAASSFPAL
jgi:hypothetical protein